MKLPHARPDPRYYPPNEPPGNFAFDLIVGALMVGILVMAVVIVLIVR